MIRQGSNGCFFVFDFIKMGKSKIIGLIGILGILGSSIFLSQAEMETQIIGIKQEEISFDLKNYSEIIIELAEDTFNSHDYELHKFDCTDFSKELLKKLIHKGFVAYCEYGILKNADYPLHTWVIVEINNQRVPIEATGGYIIGDDEYKENYLVRGRNYCI